MRRQPVHPFIFAVYPILALLGHNISEVNLEVAIRPVLIALVSTGVILILNRLVFKDWQKATLITTLYLILFFSYGHVYQFLRATPIFSINLGRHRYLTIVYCGVLVIGVWWIHKKLTALPEATQLMNVVGIALLVFPMYQIASYEKSVFTSKRIAAELNSGIDSSLKIEGGDPPDIYYIILDTYARADVMLETYGYDNSEFLSQLRSLGFYVADCSRCNHCGTKVSLTSALNMDYIPKLEEKLSITESEKDIGLFLKFNLVRAKLEEIGYKTIAFDTGYEWSRISDADIYLGYEHNPINFQLLEPFEVMLIKSTAGLLSIDLQNKFMRAELTTLFKPISKVNLPFEFEDYARRQLFILDTLPTLASISGPNFVFVHVLIPHIPRIFSPEGEILSDPGFYGGTMAEPINEDYGIRGYVSEIQFINLRMLEIVQTILEQSKTPPIMIIQGDTGPPSSPSEILNAYYLRGEDNELLYPSISPVNTFRVIFDSYFGTEYGLLPDIRYASKSRVVPENFAACVSE
jgi:hypothetical protein